MGFASWQRYCTALQYWASAKLCGVEQRAPPIFGTAAITLGIGPHSSSFFFSSCSPVLSSQRLDVYHTSTHDVALVQISNACLKCAARGSLKIQDAKVTQKTPSAHHRTTLSGCIFTTKACIENWKKLVKQQYLPHMSSQYGCAALEYCCQCEIVCNNSIL